MVIQHDLTKEWTVYGSILSEVAPRSYLIKLDRGGELRRNRRFIKKVLGVNVCGQPKGELFTSEVEIEFSAHRNIMMVVLQFHMGMALVVIMMNLVMIPCLMMRTVIGERTRTMLLRLVR